MKNDPEYRRAWRRRQQSAWLARFHAMKLERGCDRCGYAEHAAALDYHHRDPAEKTLRVSQAVASRLSWERIEAEIQKCDLLCANCHRAVGLPPHPRRLRPAEAG